MWDFPNAADTIFNFTELIWVSSGQPDGFMLMSE